MIRINWTKLCIYLFSASVFAYLFAEFFCAAQRPMLCFMNPFSYTELSRMGPDLENLGFWRRLLEFHFLRIALEICISGSLFGAIYSLRKSYPRARNLAMAIGFSALGYFSYQYVLRYTQILSPRLYVHLYPKDLRSPAHERLMMEGTNDFSQKWNFLFSLGASPTPISDADWSKLKNFPAEFWEKIDKKPFPPDLWKHTVANRHEGLYHFFRSKGYTAFGDLHRNCLLVLSAIFVKNKWVLEDYFHSGSKAILACKDAPPPHAKPFLLHAIDAEFYEGLELTVAAGAPFEDLTYPFESALLYAHSLGKTSMVEKLMALGAKPDLRFKLSQKLDQPVTKIVDTAQGKVALGSFSLWNSEKLTPIQKKPCPEDARCIWGPSYAFRLDPSGQWDRKFTVTEEVLLKHSQSNASPPKQELSDGRYYQISVSNGMLTRFLANGQVDSSFAPFERRISKFSLLKSGSLIVLSTYETDSGGQAHFEITKLNDRGVPQENFSIHLEDPKFVDFKVLSEEVLLVWGNLVGFYPKVENSSLVKIDLKTGEPLDGSWLKVAWKGSVNTVYTQDDGGMIVSGWFQNIGTKFLCGFAWVNKEELDQQRSENSCKSLYGALGFEYHPGFSTLESIAGTSPYLLKFSTPFFGHFEEVPVQKEIEWDPKTFLFKKR